MRFAGVVAAAALAVACAGRGTACECGPLPDTYLAAAKADAVFVGRVFWIGEDTDTDGTVMFREYMFRISRAWKGTGGVDTAIVYDVPNDCSYPFTDGREYLVYAQSERLLGGRLVTSACLRTKPFGEAADDLVLLGPPSYLGHWLRK
ncbi:MAG TPA: hypothetical protein VD862_01770 [Candidatus Paceibacterota bacterium]|nr:hypothetical protein [Candidatus Paceibacterota bacterium]